LIFSEVNLIKTDFAPMYYTIENQGSCSS